MGIHYGPHNADIIGSLSPAPEAGPLTGVQRRTLVLSQLMKSTRRRMSGNHIEPVESPELAQYLQYAYSSLHPPEMMENSVTTEVITQRISFTRLIIRKTFHRAKNPSMLEPREEEPKEHDTEENVPLQKDLKGLEVRRKRLHEAAKLNEDQRKRVAGATKEGTERETEPEKDETKEAPKKETLKLVA